MSKSKDNKYSVNATLFSREFDIGYKPVYSLRATALSSGRYLIESKSGHGPQEVSIGDNFLNKGIIEKNDNGDLLFGERTIPVGHNLLYGVTAESKNDEKTKFAIFQKGSEKRFYKQVTLGDVDEKTGFPWSVDQYNNLVNGNNSVKVLPQLNSRSLNVRGELDAEDSKKHNLRNAYYATFDYVDSIEGRSHTTWGFYVKSQFNKGEAEFKEIINGELVSTARVRFERGGFAISIRTPETAYRSHILYEKKRDLERQIAAFEDPIFVKKTIKGLPDDAVKQFKDELKKELSEVNSELNVLKKDWLKGQRFFIKDEGRDFLLAGNNKTNSYNKQSDDQSPAP